MQIVSDRTEVIYKNVNEGKTFYSIWVSKKNLDGSYTNGYINVKFPKTIELKEDKTLIKIKNAWLDFYLKDKVTIPYIFINEFDILNDMAKDITTKKEIKNDPYENMGDIVKLTDEDLPFDFGE